MRVKVKRAGHEVARGHDRWHIDCVNAMTRPAGTRESTPEPTSDSLGSAWRRAGQRQELRDGWVFGVERSSVWSRYLYGLFVPAPNPKGPVHAPMSRADVKQASQQRVAWHKHPKHHRSKTASPAAGFA